MRACLTHEGKEEADREGDDRVKWLPFRLRPTSWKKRERSAGQAYGRRTRSEKPSRVRQRGLELLVVRTKRVASCPVPTSEAR